MTTTTAERWPNELARYLKAPHPGTLACPAGGYLPPREVRDAGTPEFYDVAGCLLALEKRRHLFGAPLESLILVLRETAAQLLDGQAESDTHETPAGFQCFSFGAIDAHDPVTTHKLPCGGHRIAFSCVELGNAGYPELAALWAGERDAYRMIAVGGGLPIGRTSYKWVFAEHSCADTRVPRAPFLARLVDVLHQSSKVRS